MKKIMILYCLGLSLLASGQPAVKLYGFSQVFQPGMIRVDEHGRSENRVITTYYIYMTIPAGVKFDHIWIDGHLYGGTVQPADSTPVIQMNYNNPNKPEKIVLVPKTRQVVWQVIPGEKITDTLARTTALKKIISSSELVISYWYKGKKYFARLGKLTVLPPVAGV